MADRDGRQQPDGATQAPSVAAGSQDGLATGADAGLLDIDTQVVGRPVKRVGFIVNDTIQAAIEQADRVGSLLASSRVEVFESHSASPDAGVAWTRDSKLDLIFTFGGDGTILRAARYAAPLGVPLVGINLGRVGFLTELNPSQVEERLPRFLEGSYWLEERTMFNAVLWRGSEMVDTFVALNDIVASRAALSRVVNCTLSANGRKVTTYLADGVIVATPTGSTAYSMAAGGPILHPELRSIVVTPIAPYLTIVKSLVLPDTYKLDLHIDTDDEAFLTVDGQTHVPLRDGDTVSVTTLPDPCLFARVQERAYFTATLVSRLRRAE
ncbi:MAG TPA: NAD(+)/NADH kinase [Chloroflexia bacterium]|nr:NAD(+)/NADH kinase [Chloroflexia bacterium]